MATISTSVDLRSDRAEAMKAVNAIFLKYPF